MVFEFDPVIDYLLLYELYVGKYVDGVNVERKMQCSSDQKLTPKRKTRKEHSNRKQFIVAK